MQMPHFYIRQKYLNQWHIDLFLFSPQELRESYNTQQLALEQLYKIKRDKLKEIERKRSELIQKKKLEDEATR